MYDFALQSILQSPNARTRWPDFVDSSDHVSNISARHIPSLV
jgi:hypothetical protein